MDANNIVLIGMPGTGKSTVGIRLARRLGYRFVDTDKLIVLQNGKTLPALIAEKGLDGFLAIEGSVGQQLKCDHCVIATGGSMVLSDAAMINLRTGGQVVWLDTGLNELERRISKHADRGIAANPGMTLAQIDHVRRPLYQEYADVRVRPWGNAEKVVLQIREALHI